MADKSTHFGYQDVSPEEKTEKVTAVFESVAGKYDVMNDVMSLGMHRLWKRQFIHLANIRPHFQVLDLAAGTGDISTLIVPKFDKKGSVILCDPNGAMLEEGRRRMVDKGLLNNLHYVQAMGESLPFPDAHFDRVMIAFGLRNFTDKDKALREIFKLLKPGGQLLVLEFSKPQQWMQDAYDVYSFKFLPKMGEVIAKDAESYQYLAESIRKHPDQETLKSMFETAGFEKCDYLNLSGGIVSIHHGHKLSI